MAQTPASILFESLFFEWAQLNGETFETSDEKILIKEGVFTPDLYILLGGKALVRTALENDASTEDSIDLAELGPWALLTVDVGVP